MRGDLEAVRRRGSIIVTDFTGTSELRPVHAYATPGEIGPVDLVIVSVKTTLGDAVKGLVEPLLGKQTAILTLQNGLGVDEYLGRLFGAQRVIGGLVFMATNRVGPGEVRIFSPGMISIGELVGPAVERTRALADLIGRSGIKSQAVDNLLEARWQKLMWNIPFNGLGIAEGVTTDRICADPRIAVEARSLMLEIQRAAGAFGIVITDEFLEKQFTRTVPMGPYRPSSLVDFLAGREVEIEPIWGEPLRRAQALGVAMPRLADLHARIVAACAKARTPPIP
jgi:2-dehydropantoate 2-reductase